MNSVWVALLLYVVLTPVFAILTGMAIVRAEPELKELRRAVAHLKATIRKELLGWIK